MANSGVMKILGPALIVLGLGLGIWGYQLSGSVGEQVTQVVTGSNTDKVMMLYIGGAVSFIAGLFLVFKR
jgi:cytosine/uracil/thiamine/allantoin permease